MKTFNYFQHLKKSAVRTLVSTGINVREAFIMVRYQMPYLFAGHKKCLELDNDKQY